MSLAELETAIAEYHRDKIESGRQEHGHPTPEQVREARSLGIEIHGMNAKSIQDAIEAKKSGAGDPPPQGGPPPGGPPPGGPPPGGPPPGGPPQGGPPPGGPPQGGPPPGGPPQGGPPPGGPPQGGPPVDASKGFYDKLMALSGLIRERGIPQKYTKALTELFNKPGAQVGARYTVDQILEMDPDRQIESLKTILNATGTQVGDDWPSAPPTTGPAQPPGGTPPGVLLPAVLLPGGRRYSSRWHSSRRPDSSLHCRWEDR